MFPSVLRCSRYLNINHSRLRLTDMGVLVRIFLTTPTNFAKNWWGCQSRSRRCWLQIRLLQRRFLQRRHNSSGQRSPDPSKSEHAKLILSENVLHHLRGRPTCIMATQSRYGEPRGWSSHWNARNLWNVTVLKRTWGSLVISSYTRIAVTWKTSDTWKWNSEKVKS